jgi:hypothetical protein
MGLSHHITVFFISEQEKRNFLEAGVEFKEITRGPRGECAIFEIGENDARWQRVAALVASLEGNDEVPKKYRVQDLSMTAPTMGDSMRQAAERIAAQKKSQQGPRWLEGYTGQSVDQILALEGEYRTDSLVLALEQAISQKAKRDGMHNLTNEERVVLAVEALEREVNGGGYDQFFTNSSREFASTIVDSLKRIGCMKTANITQRAIKALGTSKLTAEAIDTRLGADDKNREKQFRRCDDAYYSTAEPIADRLLAFVKTNRAGITF